MNPAKAHVTKLEDWIALGAIFAGSILRIYQFPDIPPGLNQDEAAVAYEAYSLILTGADRWGNPFPVYFPAWGSGQSVLYAYLSVPIIWLFGLNIFTARAVNLVFGVLLLPLQYICTKQMYGRAIALTTTILTAILPWHVMLSRWGLDANLFPFFLLLGTYTVSLALSPKSSKPLKVIALIPWAISVYAYGVALMILPIMVLLVALTYRKEIWENKRSWLGAILLFLLITFPLIAFAIKNNFLHRDFSFERFLPFSIPLLPSQRLAQVGGESLAEKVWNNILFLLSGFQDGLIWNSIPEFPPLLMIIFPFLGVGLLGLIRQFLLSQKIDLFLLWLISCSPLFLLIELNVNRANAIFIPIIVISTLGFFELKRALVSIQLQKILTISTAGWILISSLCFANYYFKHYPDIIDSSFNSGLETALEQAINTAQKEEKVLISQEISRSLSYIYILFYLKQDPRIFQTRSNYVINSEGVFEVRSFERFYFKPEWLTLQPKETFVYLVKKRERIPCRGSKPLYNEGGWRIGRCTEATQSIS
jgi:4-amino-4-deoxy-L-arabinose transferase-like glycosyltransferase